MDKNTERLGRRIMGKARNFFNKFSSTSNVDYFIKTTASEIKYESALDELDNENMLVKDKVHILNRLIRVAKAKRKRLMEESDGSKE